MVKRTMEQNIKTRNFQARNERNGIRAVSKNRREKKAVAEEVEENAINGKHQDKFQEETAEVSATMKVKVEN